MALGIGTIDIKSAKALQANFVVHTTMDLGVYATGGFDTDALLDVVGKLPNYEVLHIAAMADGTYDFHYDAVAKKLVVFVSATGAEVADTTDLASITGIQLTIFAQ